ncbi:MAG: cobalamin-binding protein [Anaerolineales bacterium]|nr:cobalamin-binding protein [Anaerolineales bacterium]
MSKNNLYFLFGLLLIVSLFMSSCTSTSTPDPTEVEPDLTATSQTATNTPIKVEPTATIDSLLEPILFTDGLNRSITLTAPAQTIVSLAPSNTEILFALGAGPQVVGREEFSDYPPQAQNITNVGGGFGDYNFELIASLQPDLILASSLQPPELIQALEDLGFTVFVLSNPTEMEGLFSNLLIVGELTGNSIQAQSLVESLRERVRIVEEKVSAVEEPLLVFYELDATEPNAPWTAGPGTFVDTLISMAGGVNLGSLLQGEWVQISIEEILVQDPDVIVLGDYTWGGITPEDVAARAGWASLSAVQFDRVYTIDDNLVSRPGPRLVDGLEEMAKLLYPELFD